MTEIDCKKIRKEMLEEAGTKLDYIRKHDGRKLKLVVVQVEGDSASDIYVRNKVKTCESVGIECEVAKLPKKSTMNNVARWLTLYNLDKDVDGVILQLPLPDHLKQVQHYLINQIDWFKDVDGLTDKSVMRLWTDLRGVRPATAEGILRLLPEDLSGRTAVILGRSDLVGKPLAKMLMDRNATVTVCHSKTDHLVRARLMRNADIIVSAIGQPKSVIIPENINKKITYIDVGINRDVNGKLCGDFVIDDEITDLAHYTPVPGGVGILTTAQVVLNLIKCYELQGGVIK